MDSATGGFRNHQSSLLDFTGESVSNLFKAPKLVKRHQITSTTHGLTPLISRLLSPASLISDYFSANLIYHSLKHKSPEPKACFLSPKSFWARILPSFFNPVHWFLERNISVRQKHRLVASCVTWARDRTRNLVRSLTGNGSHNLSVYRQRSNQPSHTGQGCTFIFDSVQT